MYNQSTARNMDYVKFECLYVFNCTITLTSSFALTLYSEPPVKGPSFDSRRTSMAVYLINGVKIRHTAAGLQITLS
jgi:hypothetical protein